MFVLGVTISYVLELIKASKSSLLWKTIYDILIGIIYSSVIYRQVDFIKNFMEDKVKILL